MIDYSLNYLKTVVRIMHNEKMHLWTKESHREWAKRWIPKDDGYVYDVLWTIHKKDLKSCS